MCDFEKLITNEDLELLEKALLHELEQKPDDVNVLMKLALIEFRAPFHDEEKTIEYLCRIVKLSPTYFEALVMKIYFLDHSYCSIDEAEVEHLFRISCDDAQKTAIAYYIKSWIYSPLHIKCNTETEKKYLLKSVELFPYTVYPFKRLGKILEREGKLEAAKECYRKAFSNVRDVLTKDVLTREDNRCMTPQSFINEYITGISLSYVLADDLKSLAE